MTLPRLLLAIFALLCGSSAAQEVVIYGGTPGGITAAISAARLGRAVTLIEYHDHIGGMTTSGLGKSDIENRAMIGGLFKEFVAGVHRHYLTKYGSHHENTKLCQDGYYAEPQVAESVLESMIAREAKITVLKGWRLKAAEVTANKLRGITIVHRRNSEVRRLRAKVFIDATYEGDLYAAAGRSFDSVASRGRSSTNPTPALSILTIKPASSSPAPRAGAMTPCPPTLTGCV